MFSKPIKKILQTKQRHSGKKAKVKDKSQQPRNVTRKDTTKAFAQSAEKEVTQTELHQIWAEAEAKSGVD